MISYYDRHPCEADIGYAAWEMMRSVREFRATAMMLVSSQPHIASQIGDEAADALKVVRDNLTAVMIQLREFAVRCDTHPPLNPINQQDEE